VGVGIDEARADDQPGGVERVLRGVVEPARSGHGHDPPARDAHVARPAGRARPVDDGGPTDDEIEHAAPRVHI
jgi:hypothetical protein